MSEPDRPVSGHAAEIAEVIAGLRQAGAAQFDPVRFRYLESMASRMPGQQENVQRVLRLRLGEALASLTEAFAQAGSEAGTMVEVPAPKGTALAELVAYIAQHAAAPASDTLDDGVMPLGEAVPELKSIRHFRSTWSTLSVDRQVTQAIVQAPENAGPLNSHMLVLRSLATMREISPDYLNRFMSYVDTLLCLDHADKATRLVVKKPRAVKAGKK